MINYYAAEFIPQGDTIGVTDRSAAARGEEHTNSFYSIMVVAKGTGRIFIDSKGYDIKPGAVFFIDRTVPCTIEPAGEVSYSKIIITPEFFDSPEAEGALRRVFYTDSEYQPSIPLTEDEAAAIAVLVGWLTRETESRAGDFRAILRAYVSLIALYLSRAAERFRSQNANRDPEYIISVTLEYVDKHFHREYPQEELAARFGYNSAYFSRMFKKHMGKNLSDYITEKRINLAADLLKTTDLTAEQVSEKVGYKSKPQFYNTFTKYKNTTPRLYRIDAKNNKLD